MKTNYELTINNEAIKLNHFKSFNVKKLPATDIKGERVKITDTRLNKSKIISYSYRYHTIRDEAINYLNERGVEVSGFMWDDEKSIYHILTTDFEFEL